MRGANRHGVVPCVGCTLATKHSGNTIVRTRFERGPRGVRLMGRTQELREAIQRRRSCHASELSSSAMPRGGLHCPRPAIFTTQPAITAITAARRATAASELSNPAADRARDRSAFADFELRISNETTAERRAGCGRVAGASSFRGAPGANPEISRFRVQPCGLDGNDISNKTKRRDGFPRRAPTVVTRWSRR